MNDTLEPSGRSMPSLLDLPPDILVIIIYKLCPISLSQLSQTCRAINRYVKNLGHRPWQHIFLTLWDDPALADQSVLAIRQPESYALDENGKRVFRWIDETRRRVEAEKFIDTFGSSDDGSTDGMSFKRASSLRTLLSMLVMTPPASAGLTKKSRNLTWVDRMLRPDRFTPQYLMRHLLHRAGLLPSLSQDRQLTAKLQVHYLTLRSIDALQLEKRDLVRLNARAYVYRIDNYRPEGWHGPFVLDDKGVMQPNWVHLAAAQWLMLANLRDRGISRPGYAPLLGAEAAWGGSAKAVMASRRASSTRTEQNTANDWASVEGIWRRIVCFMDFEDFHQYNHHGRRVPEGVDIEVFQMPNFHEATRMITMALRITKVHKGEPPFEHRPRIDFSGFSVGHDAVIGTLTGFVCMTASGYVRWHMVTQYEGDRWVTEAVQIGEPGSGGGLIGTWTGNNHEFNDPAGPTWIWKIADISAIPKDDAVRVMNHYMFGFSGDDDDDDDDDYMEDDDDSDEDEDEDEDEPDLELISEAASSSEDEDYSEMPALIPTSSLYDLD